MGFNGGVFNIDDGATVTASRLRVTGSPTLGSKAGVLNLNDGSFSVANNIRLDGGTINLKGGTLSCPNLTITNSQAPAVLNICGGVLDVDLIFGDVTLDSGTTSTSSLIGNLTQNGGSLAPGSSPGITMISGNYDLNGGIIDIEIAGVTQSSEYDAVSVGGILNINPISTELNVRFLDGFQESILPTDTFTILNSNKGIIGNFSELPEGSTLQTIDGAGSFSD